MYVLVPRFYYALTIIWVYWCMLKCYKTWNVIYFCYFSLWCFLYWNNCIYFRKMNYQNFFDYQAMKTILWKYKTLSRTRGTVVNSYDLTTCPSWGQVPNRPCRDRSLTILLWRVIQKSLKANPTSGYRQALTENGCWDKRRRRRRRKLNNLKIHSRTLLQLFKNNLKIYKTIKSMK